MPAKPQPLMFLPSSLKVYPLLKQGHVWNTFPDEGKIRIDDCTKDFGQQVNNAFGYRRWSGVWTPHTKVEYEKKPWWKFWRVAHAKVVWLTTGTAVFTAVKPNIRAEVQQRWRGGGAAMPPRPTCC